MTFDQLRHAWKIDCGSTASKILFMALAFRADESSRCWPSVETLSRECNLCERAVRNQIQLLIQRGHISVENGGGRHQTNHYTVHLTNPALDAPFQKKPCTKYTVSGSRNPAPRSENPAPDAPQLSGTVINGHSKEKEKSMSYVPTPESTARFERLRVALHEAMRRKPKQHWDYAEMSLLCEVNKREDVEDELTELLAFQKRAGRFFPHSLYALLSRWSETLDQSRQPIETNGTYRNNGQQVNGNTGTLNKPSAEKAARYTAIARRGLDKPV